MPINNQATAKLAPNAHQFTAEQAGLIQKIKQFTQANWHRDHSVFTIYGDCGTGKSLILSQLFYDFQQARHDQHSPLYQSKNYFLVNHPEVLKVYKELAGQETNVLKKNFMRPTSFINQLQKKHEQADIVIIDEAHLLLSKPDHYNNFYGDNQLSEILKLSKVVIVVFDMHQVIQTKNYWDQARLEKILQGYHQDSYHLTHQLRITARPNLINWINEFSNGKLTPLPSDAQQDYDFRVFSDAESMRQAIVAKNQEVGLSRIVSTTGYPSTLDGGLHYIQETGGFKMPWDQYNFTSTPWAEIPQTIAEVGSIYTCQGFDLNYVGLILGPPVYLDETTNQIKIDLSKQTNTESIKRRKDIPDPAEFERIQRQIILNSVNVLMKRGVYGTYLYAHDPKLRHALVTEFQKIKRSN